MLGEDKLDRMIDRLFQEAVRQGLYGTDSTRSGGYSREAILRRAAIAVDGRRLGYLDEEDFLATVARCCRMALEQSQPCFEWKKRIEAIEAEALERWRMAFSNSICPDKIGT